MAKPRIFVSSTYYDLKHLRSSLENFIDSLGFEAILSEKGEIAYSPDIPLDESCYREAGNADMFVLIIGGRYGSEASNQEKKPDRTFFERYESITRKEYRQAIAQDVPAYILIERPVYAEYRTFLKNKGNDSVNYAHVDSVNVFELIEDILSQPKNNPMFTFERYSEIEGWLREQWAGLFKEMLGRLSNHQQITSLSAKVAELGEINATLRTYLETIIAKVAPGESEGIIESEERRLEEAKRSSQLRQNRWVGWLVQFHDFDFGECISALRSAATVEEFIRRLRGSERGDSDKRIESVRSILRTEAVARSDLNEARAILDLPPLEFEDDLPTT